MIVEADSPDAPSDLLEAMDPDEARMNELHLVRFFDGKNDANDDSW